MSVFGSGIRPWKRQTETKRAADSSVPGKGELVVSDTGKVYAGDGTTQAKNLPPMLRKTDADTTYAPVELGDELSRPASDKVVFVSKAGSDSNDGSQFGKAKLTIAGALAEIAGGGGTIQIGSGTFTEPEWDTGAVDNLLIRGVGNSTVIQFATPDSALLTVESGSKFMGLADLRLTLTTAATNSTLLDASNAFRVVCHNVQFRGQHTAASGSTYRTQIGVKLRDNAGDNSFSQCHFNNLGRGVRTDTIQNYFTDCIWGTNWRSIEGGDPTGTDFKAGASLVNCTLVAGATAAATDCHIYVEGTANSWWLTNVWMEGCDTAVKVGQGAYGPMEFVWMGGKAAATTKCIDLIAGKWFVLGGITFGADPDATPAELTINATNAPNGFAFGLASAAGYDLAASAFPRGWQAFRRGNTSLSGDPLHLNNGAASGATSLLECANRARVGYSGSDDSVLLSDAGTGKDMKFGTGNSSASQYNIGLFLGGVNGGSRRNVGIGGIPSGWNSGTGIVFLRDRDAAPTGQNSNGGYFYGDDGGFTWRGGGASGGGVAKLTKEGAVKCASYTTAGRPTASAVGAGAMIFDTTLGKPTWSTGSAWVDATGATV